MRAKEERTQRDKLETTLKSLEKNFSTEENQCLYDNVNEISKKYMIILRKEYA